MTFSEYAIALWKEHRGKKHQFVAELLTAGLPGGSEIIKSLSESESGKDRLRKYLSGERGIGEIADEIQSGYDRNAFVNYISEMYDEHFDSLVRDFANKGIVIEPGNEAEQLTRIFEQLIGIHNPNSAPSTQPYRDADLLFLMRQLKTVYAKLFNDYLDFYADAAFATKKAKKTFNSAIKREYEEFKSQNEKLFHFAIKYPSFVELDELYQLGITLNLGFFCPWNNTDTPILYNDLFKRYQELLADATTALPEFFAQYDSQQKLECEMREPAP